jgi:hypothetical protein
MGPQFANPQVAKWSANRKPANCHICGRPTNPKIIKYPNLRIWDLRNLLADRLPLHFWRTLKRKSHLCTPRKRIAGHQSRFHIHVSVSYLYAYSQNLSTYRQTDPGICNRSQTHECGNWDWGLQFIFWEHLFRIFGIASLQCTNILHYPVDLNQS